MKIYDEISRGLTLCLVALRKDERIIIFDVVTETFAFSDYEKDRTHVLWTTKSKNPKAGDKKGE